MMMCSEMCNVYLQQCVVRRAGSVMEGGGVCRVY